MSKESTVLPFFNLYQKPYEAENVRISNYKEAIYHMANTVADNALENFTDEQMEKSESVNEWHKKMPNKTPECIIKYQNENDKTVANSVTAEINKINCHLTNGQRILHGGKLPDGVVTTTAPLSTTLDAQVAFREAEFNEKAFNNNEINIYELIVKDPKTNVFISDDKGEHSNEKEIIFASGATINPSSKEIVTKKYPVMK